MVGVPYILQILTSYQIYNLQDFFTFLRLPLNCWLYTLMHRLVFCLLGSSHPNGPEVVFHCFTRNSQIPNDTEHLFLCLLAICISSLTKLKLLTSKCFCSVASFLLPFPFLLFVLHISFE